MRNNSSSQRIRRHGLSKGSESGPRRGSTGSSSFLLSIVIFLFIFAVGSIYVITTAQGGPYVDGGKQIIPSLVNTKSSKDKIQLVAGEADIAATEDNMRLRKERKKTSGVPEEKDTSSTSPSKEMSPAEPARTISNQISARRVSKPLTTYKEKNDYTDFHFVHIPKCGGTSMTAILRQVACKIDETRNKDCCTNPGFCDWHAMRRCSSIKGCINHFPQRKWIFKPPPSITIMREPISRLLSAFFYRGHSPNLDFFEVRPEFKLIKDGKKPKVNFEQYIEMPEYQNIQTRMLGADSFPYRNITVNDEVFQKAKEAIEQFYFIGVQEAYDLSVKVFLREVNMSHLPIEAVHERDQQTSKKVSEQKTEIKGNKKLLQRAKETNFYDIALYELGKKRFCDVIKYHPDLYEELSSTKFSCEDSS